MNCSEAKKYTHEHADHHLEQDRYMKLQDHLNECVYCMDHFQQISQTEKMLRAIYLQNEKVELTPLILSRLPRRKKQIFHWVSWARQYPAWTMAILFSILMFSSFLMMWNQDNEFVVETNQFEKIVIIGNTVRIPPDQIIEGDLVVRNGDVQVDGEVHGNIVVMDGQLFLASTAKITGDALEIDQAIQWAVYKTQQLFEKCVSLFK